MPELYQAGFIFPLVLYTTVSNTLTGGYLPQRVTDPPAAPPGRQFPCYLAAHLDQHIMPLTRVSSVSQLNGLLSDSDKLTVCDINLFLRKTRLTRCTIGYRLPRNLVIVLPISDGWQLLTDVDKVWSVSCHCTNVRGPGKGVS